MKYRSTRGSERDLSFEDVLMSGYAKDKGLYMPEEVPKIDEQELKVMSQLTYPDLVFRIVRKFISPEELSDDELHGITEQSYQNFSHPEIIGMKKLEENLVIMELFHGVTLAFKDIALCLVGGMLDFFMNKRDKHIIALVGTSGDTGSAAIESVRGKDNIDIIVLFPQDRCSRIQQLQMTTVKDKNVHVYKVDGTSDDLDIPIKKCFENTQLVKDHNLISMNSLNWTRIMSQIPMYFYAYFKLTSSIGNLVEIIVPTGAAGNITAGCLAKKMGLPIRLVAAVNENDIMARALRQGGHFATKDEVKSTLSSAMDIQMPYNMERIMFLFSDFDASKVKLLMDSFEKEGTVEMPKDLLQQIQTIITSTHTATDKEVLRVMKIIYDQYGYVICPHTAVAVSYHLNNENCEYPRGIMSTASAAKFPDAVAEAGLLPITKGIEHLKDQPMAEVPSLTKDQDWLFILKDKIESLKKKN